MSRPKPPENPLLYSAATSTDTANYRVKLALHERADGFGRFLVIGVGGAKRTQRAQLSEQQMRDLYLVLGDAINYADPADGL